MPECFSLSNTGSFASEEMLWFNYKLLGLMQIKLSGLHNEHVKLDGNNHSLLSLKTLCTVWSQSGTHFLGHWVESPAMKRKWCHRIPFIIISNFCLKTGIKGPKRITGCCLDSVIVLHKGSDTENQLFWFCSGGWENVICEVEVCMCLTWGGKKKGQMKNGKIRIVSMAQTLWQVPYKMFLRDPM